MHINSGMEQEYENYVKLNSLDPYSKACVDYAEKWADLMEESLANEESLEDTWKQLSHKADTDGITGFMYGCAVQALAHFWVHGEQLRILHNRNYGVLEETAKGSTVNPAILELKL